MISGVDVVFIEVDVGHSVVVDDGFLVVVVVRRVLVGIMCVVTLGLKVEVR